MPDSEVTTRPRRPLALVAGLAAILVWQAWFFRNAYTDALATPYKLTASSGVLQWQPEFVYFLYYLNLYPVASVSTSRREYSVEGARKLIAEDGRSLVTDRYWTIRYGDLAKTYLYLPHVWLKGRPVRPKMLHANAFGFTMALAALFVALWHARRPVFGALLVVLMGSNPFQVNEVWANNNLFGWPITITLLLLALHVPFMGERPPRPWPAIAIATLSGLVLGTFRQIRTEPTLVLAAAVLIYLTTARYRVWLRLMLVALSGAVFVLTTSAWQGYFDRKYEEARRVVHAAGGNTYEGPRHAYHFFWHALWCGLGDFDRKYGYEWSDLSAFSYAWPILQREYHYEPSGYPPAKADEWDPLTFGVYWDRGRQYARTPQEIPEYIAIVRDKVIRDITHDPAWYVSILGRRLLRILTDGTPPTLTLGNGTRVSLPGRAIWGWLALPVGAWLLYRRAWFELKLISFAVPLMGTAFLVYSDRGTVFYSIAHLVAFAVLARLAWLRVREVRLALVAVSGRRVLVLPRRSQELAAALSAVGNGQSAPDAPSALEPGLGGRGAARLVVILGVVMGVAALAAALLARNVSPAKASTGSTVAVLRFENQTMRDELAWVGDALGEFLSGALSRARLKVVDPEAVARLDPDRVRWGPNGVLMSPQDLAVNVAADRSGASRVVVGRVHRGAMAFVACVRVLAPGARPGFGSEHCLSVDPGRLPEASARLAGLVGSDLGISLPPDASALPEAEPALRTYTEARQAVQRRMWAEAVSLLDESEKADPGFLRARELRARLQTQWRRLDTGALRVLTGTGRLDEALAALRTAVLKHPESVEARLDLGRVLTDLELYQEATTTLGPVLKTPGAPPEAYELVAAAFSARGDLSRGYQSLLEYQRRVRQEPQGWSMMAAHLSRWSNLGRTLVDLELADYQRSVRMMPPTVDDLVVGWDVRALQGDWPAARQLAFRMIGHDDPRATGVGMVHLAQVELFRGRSRLAAALAEEGGLRLAQHHLDSEEAIAMAVEARLEEGNAARALAYLEELRQVESEGSRPQFGFWEAITLGRLNRWAEAARVRARLGRDLDGVPGPTGARLLDRLDGELALQHGDGRAAVAALSRAAQLLPPRGFCSEHVPIWHSLALAHLAAGSTREAETWLDRVAGTENEHICWPVPYVHSLAMLGRLRATTGRRAAAAEAYERFLSFWGDADIAQEERSEAHQVLVSVGAATSQQ